MVMMIHEIYFCKGGRGRGYDGGAGEEVGRAGQDDGGQERAASGRHEHVRPDR